MFQPSDVDDRKSVLVDGYIDNIRLQAPVIRFETAIYLVHRDDEYTNLLIVRLLYLNMYDINTGLI